MRRWAIMYGIICNKSCWEKYPLVIVKIVHTVCIIFLLQQGEAIH